MALYMKDLEVVAPLTEIEALGSIAPEAYADGRPLATRLRPVRAAASHFDTWAQQEPQGFRQLDQLKARLQLQHLGAENEEFIAATQKTGEAWLASRSDRSAATDDAILDHLQMWASAH
jgi:hypothetical protein